MNLGPTSLRIPRSATVPTLNYSDTYGQYGEAYYLAAITLWEAVRKNDIGVPTPDYLIMPVLFLLHHYVELELKEIIHLCHSVGSQVGTPVDDVPLHHSLTELLHVVDSHLGEILGPDMQTFLGQEYRELIEDLDEFGAKGEALRYPSSRGGGPTLPTTFVANVPSVISIVQEFRIEVEGPQSELREREQVLLEQPSELET